MLRKMTLEFVKEGRLAVRIYIMSPLTTDNDFKQVGNQIPYMFTFLKPS
jgi:hypothetical protein